MLRLLLLSLVCLLAACGQKGPLFLPTTPVVAPPVAVQPAESIPGSTEESSQNTPPAAPRSPDHRESSWIILPTIMAPYVPKTCR
jgi:predicted small lipoprotein YifL